MVQLPDDPSALKYIIKEKERERETLKQGLEERLKEKERERETLKQGLERERELLEREREMVLSAWKRIDEANRNQISSLNTEVLKLKRK